MKKKINSLSLKLVPVKTDVSDHYYNLFTLMILIGSLGKPREVLKREIHGHNLMLTNDSQPHVEI